MVPDIVVKILFSFNTKVVSHLSSCRSTNNSMTKRTERVIDDNAESTDFELTVQKQSHIFFSLAANETCLEL